MNDNEQNIDPMGRMNDPDAAAWITGLCGDTMEFYLVFSGDRVEEAWYHTDGCSSSRQCGTAAARLAKGKTIEEVLAISPAQILEKHPDLPDDGVHCSILAVSTLHKALADWLLKLR